MTAVGERDRGLERRVRARSRPENDESKESKLVSFRLPSVTGGRVTAVPRGRRLRAHGRHAAHLWVWTGVALFLHLHLISIELLDGREGDRRVRLRFR